MKQKESKTNLSKLLRFARLSLAFLVLIILVVILIRLFFSGKDTEQETLQLEDTSAIIERVRPKGELYLYSVLAEDFVTRQEEERHMLLFTESHSCVQMVQQKISFVLDLDEVVYTPDSGNVVLVRLPELRYVASTQSTQFMSDDEEYWKKLDTDPLKREVERKLRRKYDTKETRKQALANGRKAVAELLLKFGYEVRFVGNEIEKKDGVEIW